MSDTNGGRARAYQALRDSEELHRATLESISDAVFLTDDTGRFTFICPNVDVIFGFAPDEVQAMGRIESLLGADLLDPAALAARGEIRNIELDVTAKAGERRSLLVHVKRVSIRGSTRLYTCRDVTERRQAEEQLRVVRLELMHASRLALVGELSASIAHEINQPLGAILSNAAAALLQLERSGGRPDATELRETLVDIRAQGRRTVEVIQRVRALTGKRPLERRPVDVNGVVGEIVHLVEGEARRRGVSVHTELGPALPSVAADRVCLQQVLLNLMLNAMDAMDDVKSTPRRLSVRTRRLSDTIEVAVSDSGHGIPEDALPQLFDAFFTTKPQGLGLGLVIARSIVEAHGGRIWAENLGGGGGAAFLWTLPAPAASA